MTVACVSTRAPGGALEPRFVAVHNALAAMGLAQVGPIREGALAEGREARVPLELPAGCTTIVAIGGDGVRDLDITLLGPQGAPAAHDTTNEPQAVLRACFEAPDAYVLVVRVVSGAGSWVAATWEGGVGAAGPGNASMARPGPEPAGTCESPIPLSEGAVTGTTAHGESAHAGSCARNSARELVYELDVPRRQRVTIEIDAHFDSVLYVRKDDCADEKTEVACNDDPPEGGRNQSRIEKVLEPGKYFVFVDGYSQEGGSFKLTLSTSDVLALADACRRAPSLTAGLPATGSTRDRTDDAEATCGGGAEGADAAWSFSIASRSRVRITEHSDEFTPVVHVRRACADPYSELACGEPVANGADAAVTAVLDAGDYAVFADARDSEAAGAYALQLETAPVTGSGGAGEGCGDALPLVALASGALAPATLGSGATPASGALAPATPPNGAGAGLNTAGDTFAARDDVAGSCGGAGAADTVYRVDVPRRSRLSVALQAEEAPHVLVLWRRCGDRGSEVACARTIDEVLPAGTYFLAVDGTWPEAMGRYMLAWTLQDVTLQAGACQSAPALVERRATAGTTVGAGDKFSASCAGGDANATGPDRVFRFALTRRATVRLTLAGTTFDAALALRKACADGSGAGSATASADVSELACETSSGDAHRATIIERTLEAGTYWVVVDGQSAADQGSFTLDYRVLR
jgi:hypothetical protein